MLLVNHISLFSYVVETSWFHAGYISEGAHMEYGH